MDPLSLLIDHRYEKHLTGHSHPESPHRISAIYHLLQENHFLKNLPLLSPRFATKEELSLCHNPNYISLVEEECQFSSADGTTILSTGDVTICPESFQIAKLAVGGVLVAVDSVLKGSSERAFVAVRPPGHHAETNRGMGFCLFNNVAIGARWAQKIYNVKRILIIDWDVHHGNGTQEIFYSDPSVFYFSTHQWPLYPGTGSANETGEGQSKGTNLNVPIAPGPDSTKKIFSAFDLLEKEMQTFCPELILISAGFDAHRLDPIGGLILNEADYINLTKRVIDLATCHTKGKIISVLEGGYHLEALPASVFCHVNTLFKDT